MVTELLPKICCCSLSAAWITQRSCLNSPLSCK